MFVCGRVHGEVCAYVCVCVCASRVKVYACMQRLCVTAGLASKQIPGGRVLA